MGLVCSICKKKARHLVEIDVGRFTHHFYYCQLHKPESFELRPLGDKQVDDKKPIREVKFDKLKGEKPEVDSSKI